MKGGDGGGDGASNLGNSRRYNRRDEDGGDSRRYDGRGPRVCFNRPCICVIFVDGVRAAATVRDRGRGAGRDGAEIFCETKVEV